MSRPATGTDMSRLDLSFLHEEEASKILQVLDRDEALRRTERDRLRKLETSKRDVKWLHAVSGEWFEEIQKKKFKNDPDVRSLVRPPLAHRLKKKTPKGDSESSRMSSSKNYQSPKSSNSGPSFLKIRSPFASLFSFRKSKHEVKLPAQTQRYNIFSTLNRPPPSTEPVKKKFEIYQSARSVKQIASIFETHQKETNQNLRTDAQLQKEAFQVLGDLDQKLAQEQSYSHPLRTNIASTYKYGSIYNKESTHHNKSDSRKEYSTLSSHGGRTVSLGETHTTHATYKPRRFYEVYSVRHHSTSKSDCEKSYAKSPTPFCDSLSKPPSFAPTSGRFSSSSLNLPSESLEHERIRPHKPKRIPITSIRWNKSSASSQPELPGRPFRTQSALDLTKCSNPPQQNRIFDLYNSNKVSSSDFNDFHKVNYQNDLTCETFQNRSDKCSTGYYKTDSPGFRAIAKFQTQTNSQWKEESQENDFKLNKVTSQAPSYGTKANKDTEPMEVLHYYPSLDNDCNLHDKAANFMVSSNNSDPYVVGLQTENISAKSDMSTVDIEPCRDNSYMGHPKTIVASEMGNKTEEDFKTSPSGFSELESMEVDVPKASFPSTEEFSSTAKDLRIVDNSDQKYPSLVTLQKPSSYTEAIFTNQDRAIYAYQSSKQSVEPNTINKDSSHSTNVFTSSKPIGGSDTTSKNTSTDIAERLLMLRSRRGSKGINLQEYKSDMLKYQKKNASSLPDLIDQKNYLGRYTDDSSQTIKSEEKPIENSLTTVSNTKVTAKTHQMCSENIISQSFTSHKEDADLRTLDSCSLDSVTDRTAKEREQNIPLLEKVSFLTDAVISLDGNHNQPNTVPSYLDEHNRYKSMYVNNHPNYIQYDADTNNNKPVPKTVQTSQELSEAVESHHVFDSKRNNYSPERMKTPEYGMFPKPKLFIIDEKDVSVTNQPNVNRGTQDVETDKRIIHNFLTDLNPQWTNKITEIDKQPRIQSITVIPKSRIVEDPLQSKCCTKDNPEKKSLNLLKEHLLLAPETFKKNINSKEDTKPPFSGSGLTPNIYRCESMSHDIASVEIGSISEFQQTSKTYTCQGVTERTQIYETCYTDSSQPDVDTVEYHKVVSVYYTLPRKVSKKLLDVSKNNLKNIDQSLENRQVPSTLLEKIINKCPETEENHDFSNQNMVKTSPSHCAPKNVLSKEFDSVETPLSQQHLLNYNLIPLQSNLVNRNNTSFPGAETTLTDSNLIDQFSSLHISENSCDLRGNGSKMQRNTKITNESSPTRTSPRHSQNTYYTLPNRKSNLQDLERNILENDVALARNRYNLYSKRGNTFPTAPESEEVLLSPTFDNDYNFNGGCNSTNFQERQVNDKHNFLNKGDGWCNKESFGDEVIYREDIPSFYKSKMLKDLNKHQSHHTIDTSPSMETKSGPQSHNQPYTAKVNEPLNRTRPSYTSEFVQKKMKPINAKKFTFSFDNSGQREHSNSQSSESFSEILGQSDVDSPSVFYSPKDNNPPHVNKHYYGQKSSTECRSSQSSNIYRSKSLKNVSHDCQEEDVEIRRRSDGNFSSKTYGGNMKGGNSSGTNCGDGTRTRRYSAEMIDENDNWPDKSVSNERSPVYTAKAVDYGIFGKEQQEALLNNVKRSLTEGRLWRPSFLKNPRSLSQEEHYTSQKSPQTDCKPDNGLQETLNIYEDEVPPNSETDTDTTTDDEYYLDENDKESEL
ncbi:exophilin-5 [Mantella aurantiaca]